MKVFKLLDKFFSILIDALFIVAILVIIIFVICPFFNINNYEILSGSMEPTIKTHSLVLTNNNIDINKLKENDIILFKAKNDYVVHRAVEIDKTKKQITTKGDANKDVDYDKLSYNDVIGKVIFKSYTLGLITIYISQRKYKILFLIIIVSIFILKTIIHTLIKQNSQTTNNNKKEIESS